MIDSLLFSQTQYVRTFVVIQSFAAGLFGQLQNFLSGTNTVFSLGCFLCLWQQFLEKEK
jgi:hypothetical protein